MAGAIVAVNPATTIVQPTANVFNYAYLNSSYSYLGTLNGITSEPVFVGKINDGAAALTLDIDHYPLELSFGNLIRVNYPSGQVAGYWKYEGKKSVMGSANQYTLTLTPLGSELAEIAFNANYSTDTTQPTTALGPVTFDVPVLAAISRTMHLTAGSNLINDGNPYSYVFNNCTGQDTVNQAMIFAGSAWWYYIDPTGVVSMSNTSPFTHEWAVGREVVAGEWDDDIISLWNGQPVIGGTGPDGLTSLSAFAQDTNVGNPYSVPNIGERTNQPYQDTSLVDQGSVNTVAASLLGYAERVTSTRKLTITNYTLRKPQPGDACLLDEPDPSASDPTQNNNLVTQGPYLLTDVQEIGAQNKFIVTVSASMVVPVMAFNPQMTEEQALLKLIQNPQIQPVSNNGTVGNIGNGVVGGSASSAPLNATPSPVTGLADTTGLDNIAQLNNAYVSFTWSANSASDGVSNYLMRYRRSTDPDTAASYYQERTNALGLKIGGLYQGTSYTFQIAPINSAGVQGPWVTSAVTTSLDTTAPAVPTNLTAYRTPRGALVSWSPGIETAGGTAPDLQGYSLQVAIDGTSTGWQQVTPSGAYSLNTSMDYTAPSGTPEGTILYFRVAAIDWSGNLSAYCSQSPAIYTDGVSFEELTVGQLNVFGLLTATGGLSTRSTSPGTATGPGFDLSGAALTAYDGTTNNYGAGAGVTTQLNATNGAAFFSGTVSASQIQGVAGGSSGAGQRMWLDFKDTSAGVGPLLDVSDGTYDRVQIGNLAVSTDGNSPPQIGIRVNNSGGTSIFDSGGLIAAATIIGSGNGSNVALPGSLGGIAGTNVLFTMSRTLHVMLIGIASVGGGNNSTGFNYFASIGVSGQSYGPLQNVEVSATGSTSSSVNIPLTSIYVLSLPAGSYTCQWQGYETSGGFSNQITTWQTFVLQLGS